MAQLIKPQIKWTEEKIHLLEKEYPNGDKKELCVKLGIKYKTLKNAARRFNVKSEKDLNFYRLKPLYEDSLLAYYWLGFVMADGHIDNEGELKITLSRKDLQHLEKLGALLGVKVKQYKQKTYSAKERDYCRLSCKDSFYGPLLLKKMGLNGLPKTYNPPTKIEFKNTDGFLAFMCGLIDGDGTFSRNNWGVSFIRLEMHCSWKDFLKQCSEKLKYIAKSCSVGVNKRGFSFMRIYRKNDIKSIKDFAIKNNLPILSRKWECVS